MSRAPARRLLGALACLVAVVLVDPVAAEAPPPEAPGGDVAGAASAEPPCDDARAQAVAAAVQRRYDAVRHLAADFEQTTESVVLGMSALGDDDNASVSRGQVLFSKPGRMRWTYREPDESYVISDGSVLWIYDVAARQATRLPVGKEVLAGAALQFLLGEGRLAETYRIAARACASDRVELDLSPIEPASYERLGLTADPATGLIAETSVVDLFGNRTRIRFEDLVVGQSPPEDAFRFEVPAGVEVIDMGPPR